MSGRPSARACLMSAARLRARSDAGAHPGHVRSATGSAAMTSCRDIEVVSPLDDRIFPELHAPFGDAFAGLHVVFHAVPGTDEIHLGFREEESERGLVRPQAFLDPGDGQPFAGRPVLMEAVVAVGVEMPFMPEYADLLFADAHDAAVAVLELRCLRDECLDHPLPPGRRTILVRRHLMRGSTLNWWNG